MNTAKTILSALCAIALGQGALSAQDPLWLRKCEISPDGTLVAFCYKGDIYTVSSTGGEARQITSNQAYDSDPMWTRDGKWIVFSSYREGGKDIFMTRYDGGVPKRITNYPGSETPMAVLPDGRILFSASIQSDASYVGFPGGTQLYMTDTTSSKMPSLVTSLRISEISVSRDGRVLYEDYKGYEDPMRKHHTSSVTRDIYLYEGASLGEGFRIDGSGTFTQLTSYSGEDRDPFFLPGTDTYYYISEQDGSTLNIFKGSTSGGTPTQLTFGKDYPARYVSVSDDGLILYSMNGELYTLREGGSPSKLSITLRRDESERQSIKRTLSSGASAIAVSEKGKEVAFVAHGDVFVTSEEYRTTKRITDTPCQERGVSFNDDGRELYYASERDGFWGIYRSVLSDKSEKCFTYATKIKEELFSEKDRTSFQPQVSPDGKWVAYLRDRTELVVKRTSGGAVKSLLKDVNYSYTDGDQSFEWSPDSRFLLCNYQANGGWNNSDVAVIEVDTGKVIDLTESGYSDGSFRWALGGKAMTWESDRNGYRSHGSWGAESDIYIMFFDGKAMTEFTREKEDDDIEKMRLGEKKAEKKEKKDSLEREKPKKLDPDFEHREDRIRRLTKSSASLGDHFLSPDGRKLYYVTPLENGRGLCELDIRKGEVRVLQRGVSGRITPSKDGKSIYVLSGNGISKIDVGAGGKQKAISFSGEFQWRPAQEREYMFSHVWRQVKEKFYDPALHGVDWDGCRENYSRFLPHINNNFDFAEMLSEMLGELNGSHTGARYYAPSGESLGRLGILFDWDYKGDGIKIREVLPDGVLNLADSEIKAGNVIESIDGHKIEAGENWLPLLSGKAGKRVAVTVRKGGKKVDLIVKPSSSESTLLYRRWVRKKEALAREASGGKVGYVHVKGMDSPSFRDVYSRALGKYRTCDALVVDTRHNGGGWLHDDLATFLSGKGYIRFTPRGQYIGTEPYSKWTKPSCVLVCQDNYSDASGFPYVYKTLGIGKLVGTPVPGTMTAVWWERLIDSSIVFGIPQVGSWAVKEGRYLENFDLAPDVLVYDSPKDLLTGRDPQLEAAVREMLKGIDHNTK